MKFSPNIESISKVVDRYDVFILDQWGVMHDGSAGYFHAVNCINKLAQLKKKLIIVSNTSKRKKTTFDQLTKLGFEKNSFFEIITSGEMIWQNLYTKSNKFIKTLGSNCYHFFDQTKEDGLKYIEGLDYNFVNNIEDADFILGCTPSYGFTTLDYVPLLEKAIKRNIPFICANPDFETVESSLDKLIICMGTIAELYKDFGGKVFIMGKPSILIYQEATKHITDIDKSKILAVGDSIYHDIKGANAFGIDSLLVTTGIHKSCFDDINPKWESNINKLKNTNIIPTYLSSKFQF